MKTPYFERNPWRELPDGRIVKVFPFHISLEGNEIKVLCRDDDDYDTFVKIMAVCAKRKSAILAAFGIVSNHGHSVILAENKDTADRFGQEVKKMFSMYFRKKYGDSKYVEAAFENDPSIFVQKIGNTNIVEMHRRLEDNPKVFRKDEEVLRSVRDLSMKWFSSEIHDLPYEKKIRLLTYYFRSNRTSTSQMARIFEMPREEVSLILKKNGLRTS